MGRRLKIKNLIGLWILALLAPVALCAADDVKPTRPPKPLPCLIGQMAPAPPQKELSTKLRNLVATHLPEAIKAKRTVGVEIEFGGLNTQGDIDALTKAAGGTLDGGMIRLKPDAVPRIIATELNEVSGKPSKVIYRADAVDGHAYDFTWEDWGVLRTPGSNWIEGIWSPEEALARVTSWKGIDVALKPNTFIRNSPLGDIDIHSEPVGKGKAGIEFVTPPITHDKLPELLKVQAHLTDHAKGVREGYSSGVHVNVGIQDQPVEDHPKILRRMILRWSKIRADVVKRFEPSSIRVSPIDDDRPFYGDYTPAFLVDLKSAGEGITKEQFLALMDKHYADREPEYRGKWLDVNPIPILMKGQSRIEFRLFNGDFHRGQEKYMNDAVELCLAAVQQAVSEPLP